MSGVDRTIRCQPGEYDKAKSIGLAFGKNLLDEAIQFAVVRWQQRLNTPQRFTIAARTLDLCSKFRDHAAVLYGRTQPQRRGDSVPTSGCRAFNVSQRKGF